MSFVTANTTKLLLSGNHNSKVTRHKNIRATYGAPEQHIAVMIRISRKKPHCNKDRYRGFICKSKPKIATKIAPKSQYFSSQDFVHQEYPILTRRKTGKEKEMRTEDIPVNYFKLIKKKSSETARKRNASKPGKN